MSPFVSTVTNKLDAKGRVSIPDQKSGTLIQPAGQSWRGFHENTLPWVGAIAILGMLAVLVILAVLLARGH